MISATFNVATMEPFDQTGRTAVEGWVSGNGRAGIHQFLGHWTITHLATGLRICYVIDRLEACRLAELMSPHLPEAGVWGVGPEMDDGLREVGRIKSKAVRDYLAY